MVKRFVDVVISSLLLLLTLPVLVLAALLIRLTSPGPVLFRQLRMGRGFQTFEILKLRTMAHAEAGLAFTFGPDPRITPVGAFLRRTKLDELPQLWNVLRGQMSLVGPRPVVPELTEEFRDLYVLLLRERPGLTDPGSLKYSQEAALLVRSQDPMGFFKNVVTPDKIRISFEYMSRANLWTDLAIMGMTAMVCCFPTLSALYGELPEVPDPVEDTHVQEIRPPKRTEKVAPAADGSIFAHELASMEAARERGVPADILPWIRLPNPNLAPQSASSSRNRPANRL